MYRLRRRFPPRAAFIQERLGRQSLGPLWCSAGVACGEMTTQEEAAREINVLLPKRCRLSGLLYFLLENPTGRPCYFCGLELKTGKRLYQVCIRTCSGVSWVKRRKENVSACHNPFRDREEVLLRHG